MLFRLFRKLVWFTTKKTVKYVVVPIAISAAVGAAMGAVSEKIREGGHDRDGNVRTVIRPEP